MNEHHQSPEEAVVAVATHRNLEGLQRLVPALLKQTVPLGLELIVVDSASTDGTKEWLAQEEGRFTVLRLQDNEGPGAAFNGVFAIRPRAEAYLLFADDALLHDGEVKGLLRSLRSDERIGIVAGESVTEMGVPLASAYRRRPFGATLPLLWDRWWGRTTKGLDPGLEYVDVVGGSGMALRGAVVQQVGSFETILWPSAFEDLDYCARAKFVGWEIVVDHGVKIHQEVSVTMTKVFGHRYSALRRVSGLLYAALNYPLVIAIGRLIEAGVNALTASDPRRKWADAQGLLRCSRSWWAVLEGRRVRRRLRRFRNARLA